MTDILTDEEMEALEAKHKPPGIISDDEMAKLEEEAAPSSMRRQRAISKN